MLDSARVQSVIEIIDQCLANWHLKQHAPADVIIHQYFKQRRFMGSKDRAAIAELTYYIIRHLRSLEWWTLKYGLDTGRSLVIAALAFHSKHAVAHIKRLFNGDKFAPEPLGNDEEQLARFACKSELLQDEMTDDIRYNVPAWMLPSIKVAMGDSWREGLLKLNEEAPVDLRTNTLLTTRDELIAELTKEGFKVAPTPHSPIGVRMQTRAPIFTSKCFKQGWFEMQDEGSQLVSLVAGAKPGQRVIDFCAGAGGKTLAIAAQMENKGRILAWDISESRLGQMPERLKRAKVDNVQRHLLASESDEFLRRHQNSADIVVIDAPCSGSGTWRRNPDLKWRTSEADVNEIISVQRKILQNASRLVKSGGHLLYITCSIFSDENETQIAAFMSQSEKFKVVSFPKIWSNPSQQIHNVDGTLHLMPHKDGTDGFFATMLQRVA